MVMPYLANKKNKISSKKLLPIIFIVLILAAIGFWILHQHQHNSTSSNTTVPTNTGTPAVANPNVPGSNNPNPTTGGGASKDEGDNTPGAAPGSGVQPVTPTGQFVSNHAPNLSGHPASNQETSACTTTPGVQCKIMFTFGSAIKSLPAQRTDANGNTLWSNWTLQSIGLTKGTWKVSAVAINGAKTASGVDAAPLVVSE